MRIQLHLELTVMANLSAAVHGGGWLLEDSSEGCSFLLYRVEVSGGERLWRQIAFQTAKNNITYPDSLEFLKSIFIRTCHQQQ